MPDAGDISRQLNAVSSEAAKTAAEVSEATSRMRSGLLNVLDTTSELIERYKEVAKVNNLTASQVEAFKASMLRLSSIVPQNISENIELEKVRKKALDFSKKNRLDASLIEEDYFTKQLKLISRSRVTALEIENRALNNQRDALMQSYNEQIGLITGELDRLEAVQKISYIEQRADIIDHYKKQQDGLEKNRNRETSILSAAAKENERMLMEAKRRESSVVDKGSDNILVRWRGKFKEMALDTESKVQQSTGLQAGFLTKMLAGFAILGKVAETLFKAFLGAAQDEAKARELLVKTGQKYNITQREALEIINLASSTFNKTGLTTSEGLKLVDDAIKEFGFSSAMVAADSGRLVASQAQLRGMMFQTVADVTSVGRAFGMASNESVKLAFHISKTFRIGPEMVSKTFTELAKASTALRIPTDQFMNQIAKIGEEMTFTGRGVEEVIGGFSGMVDQMGKTKGEFGKLFADFPAAKFELAQAAFQAFGRISPEQMMAFTGAKGPFGAEFFKASLMTPMEKMKATIEKMLPTAEKGAKGPEDVIGRLMKLTDLQGASGARLAQFFVENKNNLKLTGADAEKQLQMFAKSAGATDAELKQLGQAMGLVQDPLKIIADRIEKLLQASLAFFIPSLKLLGHLPGVGSDFSDALGSINTLNSLKDNVHGSEQGALLTK